MQEDGLQMSWKNDIELSCHLEYKEFRLAANSTYESEITRVKGKIMHIALFCMDLSCLAPSS